MNADFEVPEETCPRRTQVFPKRPFTEQELEAVRLRYPTEGAFPLAVEMGRSQSGVVALAQRIGVRFNGLRAWATDDDARLVELFRQGSDYKRIAILLNRSKSAVAKRAQIMGLSKSLCDFAAHRKRCVEPRQHNSGCVEIRWARARLRLGEHGWPPDLNPKEIRILESLRVVGPQVREILSASIGEPPTRHRFKRLMGHGGRSSMARLLARRLVTRCFVNNHRKRATVYALTLTAMQMHGRFESVASFNLPIINKTKEELSMRRRCRGKVVPFQEPFEVNP